MSFLVERQKLARDLQRFRLVSGVSTYELAQRLEVSQSKVSKIENARVAVSAVDARKWVLAVGASEEKAAEVAARAEKALLEAVTWRANPQDSLAARQHGIAAIEHEAAAIHGFYTALVPGLLQTADYARRVFLQTHADHPDVRAAVAARVERQSILYDDAKVFEFLLSESLLHSLPPPRALTLSQLDRLRSVTTLPNVRIGVISLDGFAWAWHEHAFTIYEGLEEGEGIVHVETLTAVVNVTDPTDVQTYRRAFDELRAAAVFGDAVLARIDQVMKEVPQPVG